MDDDSRVHRPSPDLTHVYEQLLIDACRAWPDLEIAMVALAESAVLSTSRLGRDVEGLGPADDVRHIAEYPLARAGNAARLLRALRAVVLESVPGAAVIDTTAMYPLLRALLEDAATMRWLTNGSTPRERCLRSLRLLRSDARYVDDAQNLVERTLGSLPLFVDRSSRSGVSARISEASSWATSGFERAISAYGLELRELDKRPLQSEVVRGAYGDESIEFATWKLLSNLAHFSYSVERSLPSGPGLEGQEEIVLLIALVSETNGAAVAAIESFSDALLPS